MWLSVFEFMSVPKSSTVSQTTPSALQSALNSVYAIL